MKTWWQQLDLREQRLVMLMSVLVSIFVLYSLIWQPMNESIVKHKTKIARQQALLTLVQEGGQRYQQAKLNGITGSRGSLSSIVNRTSKLNNITITRMQPQGDDLQVWIDEISFNKLLSWLDHLASTENLQVKSIDLNKADQQGVVSVRRLQLGKN